VHAGSDVLDSCERIILAGDSDGPGVLLADELARRIGREKCWRVAWPSGPQDSLAPGAAAAAAASNAAAAAALANGLPEHPLQPAAARVGAAQAQPSAAVALAEPAEGFARKDANEVLVRDGAQVLVAYLEAAQPLPIRGLFTFMDFWPQVGAEGWVLRLWPKRERCTAE
jgi:twinkle protein